MTFPHEGGDFGKLLRIVAEKRGLNVALVEKDYWVTVTLWALHDAGFDLGSSGVGADAARRAPEAPCHRPARSR